MKHNLSNILRFIARRASTKLEHYPNLHASLKHAFLRIPEQIRGRQMIYDHLLSIASDNRSCTFLVIGANDGITNDPLYPLAKRYRWRGILVEPVPAYFEELKEAYRGLPVTFENVAVHRTEKTMTLHYLDDQQMKLPAWAKGVGSFDRSKVEGLSEIPGRGKALASIEVPCLRLEEIVEKSGLDRIAVISIDTEGYDGEILRQVCFDDWGVETVIFEHKLLSEDDLTECLSLLERHGFSHEKDAYDILATREVPLQDGIESADDRSDKDPSDNKAD